jgi:Uma2 family endonuclease
MTFEEWFALDEDEPGELVDGLLVEAEMTNCGHETVVVWLTEHFRLWGRTRGRAFVLGSGVKYKVTPRRGRMPDASVFLPGDPAPPRDGVVQVPPSIAVEVVSATPRDQRRDRIEKTAEYAVFGIRWYWIIDPQVRTFEIFELGADGRYVRALGASDGVVESVPGCEGLVLDLSSLWAEIDALPEGEVGAPG